MDWTTPDALKAQLQKLWDKGALLQSLVAEEGRFPLRLRLKKPLSDDLSGRFNEVRSWISQLQALEKRGYRLTWRQVRHRVIGANNLPDQVWVDSPHQAIRILGMTGQAERYMRLRAEIVSHQPSLAGWLTQYPLRVITLEPIWDRLLLVIRWLQDNPRPDIYLRELDLPGIDSKFMERHRGILAELLDLTLVPEAICREARGIQQFNRRFGFRDKPLRVRFRFTDVGNSDREIESREFAQLNPQVSRVFVVENEITFLTFPPGTNSLIIFGRGYGFDMLAPALWLRHKTLYYWGDIDTHGLAILSQFRQLFPHTASFLMDAQTLLAHHASWDKEPKQCLRTLSQLMEDEHELYRALIENQYGDMLRLEQEHISMGWINKALQHL